MRCQEIKLKILRIYTKSVNNNKNRLRKRLQANRHILFNVNITIAKGRTFTQGNQLFIKLNLVEIRIDRYYIWMRVERRKEDTHFKERGQKHNAHSAVISLRNTFRVLKRILSLQKIEKKNEKLIIRTITNKSKQSIQKEYLYGICIQLTSLKNQRM